VPVMAPESLIPSIKRVQERSLITPFLAGSGLKIVYTLNTTSALMAVDRENMTDWGVDEATIKRAAVANMRARVPPRRDDLFHASRTDDGAIIVVYHTEDMLAASPLAVPDTIAAWFGDEPRTPEHKILAVAPSRDWLVACLTKDPTDLIGLTVMAIELGQMTHNALSPSVFEVEGKRIRVHTATQSMPEIRGGGNMGSSLIDSILQTLEQRMRGNGASRPGGRHHDA
jgi:hypothetical protein